MCPVEINDYDQYTSGMSKSIWDKLFFMDKLDNDIKSVIDYGCANGILLEEIHRLVGDEYKLIGYDINEDMIQNAKIRLGEDYEFFLNFQECLNKVDTENTILNLSSVIHEVYSYSREDEIEQFWKNVFESGFKYISIRDLCLSNSANRKVCMNDYTKLICKAHSCQIDDYEQIWGSLQDNRNLIHFLMKYRYIANWDREVHENYFPLPLEELLRKIPIDRYEIIYFEHYNLPFTQKKIKEDFDIVITDRTHVKLLLQIK